MRPLQEAHMVSATQARELTTLHTPEDELLLQAENTKISPLKEAAFCALTGAVAGGVTGLFISGLGYANTGIGASFAVAGIASSGASALGATVGVVAKRIFTQASGCRFGRAALGALTLGVTALTVGNVAAWGTPALISMPLWSQFAVGVPAALLGFTVAAAPKTEEMGAIVAGGLVSISTGTCAGAALGSGLGALFPSIGPATGAMYGLLGMQAVGGYACFSLVKE